MQGRDLPGATCLPVRAGCHRRKNIAVLALHDMYSLTRLSEGTAVVWRKIANALTNIGLAPICWLLISNIEELPSPRPGKRS